MDEDSKVMVKGEWVWRKNCPIFGGKQSEYKGWKGQVEDWLVVCGEDVKYPGIEIRLSLQGKALEVTEGIDRIALKSKGGEKVILDKLDSVYLKDTLMENYGKMKNYFKIERGSGERMSDFIVRYEKAASECSKAMGKNMLEGEAKGFHVLEQANLTDNQKQMVLAALGVGKLDYDAVSKMMKRIFEGLGNKDDSDWWGSETYGNRPRPTERGVDRYRSRGRMRWNRGKDGRNPVDREGKVTLCVLCNSEWHWARDCPHNYRNKERQNEQRAGGGLDNKVKVNQGRESEQEKIYIGDIQETDFESWGEVDAILDTGCRSTVCGEL